MTMAFNTHIPQPPPIPPPRRGPPSPQDLLSMARYWMDRGCASVDQVWLVREDEQGPMNERRRKDWEIRFKVLGPRPESS